MLRFPVRFFRESVAGDRVKQSLRTLQELAGGKSFELLQSLWTLPPATLSWKNITGYAKFERPVNPRTNILTYQIAVCYTV